MTYNLTAIGTQCATSATGCLVEVNSGLLQGFLGIFILSSLAVILGSIYYSKTYDMPKSIAGALTVLLIGSIPLWAIGLVPIWFEFIIIVGAGISLAFISRQF